MATPTGPAGGDLNGTYPNPGVTGLAGVISQSAANAAALVTVTADLVTAETNIATNAAAINTLESDVSTLQTQVAAITPTYGGTTSLDGAGNAAVYTPTNVTIMIACWFSGNGTGMLSVTPVAGNQWTIHSSAGGVDSGYYAAWIAN